MRSRFEARARGIRGIQIAVELVYRIYRYVVVVRDGMRKKN